MMMTDDDINRIQIENAPIYEILNRVITKFEVDEKLTDDEKEMIRKATDNLYNNNFEGLINYYGFIKRHKKNKNFNSLKASIIIFINNYNKFLDDYKLLNIPKIIKYNKFREFYYYKLKTLKSELRTLEAIYKKVLKINNFWLPLNNQF